MIFINLPNRDGIEDDGPTDCRELLQDISYWGTRRTSSIMQHISRRYCVESYEALVLVGKPKCQ